jgi:hypothetical protein
MSACVLVHVYRLMLENNPMLLHGMHACMAWHDTSFSKFANIDADE